MEAAGIPPELLPEEATPEIKAVAAAVPRVLKEEVAVTRPLKPKLGLAASVFAGFTLITLIAAISVASPALGAAAQTMATEPGRVLLVIAIGLLSVWAGRWLHAAIKKAVAFLRLLCQLGQRAG